MDPLIRRRIITPTIIPVVAGVRFCAVGIRTRTITFLFLLPFLFRASQPAHIPLHQHRCNPHALVNTHTFQNLLSTIRPHPLPYPQECATHRVLMHNPPQPPLLLTLHLLPHPSPYQILHQMHLNPFQPTRRTRHNIPFQLLNRRENGLSNFFQELSAFVGGERTEVVEEKGL